jgi:hypothetical protein
MMHAAYTFTILSAGWYIPKLYYNQNIRMQTLHQYIIQYCIQYIICVSLGSKARIALAIEVYTYSEFVRMSAYTSNYILHV